MSTSSNVVVPVVVAGGSGERLWPLSRASLPKPFLALPFVAPTTTSEDAAARAQPAPRCLIHATFERIEALRNAPTGGADAPSRDWQCPHVVTCADWRALLEDAWRSYVAASRAVTGDRPSTVVSKSALSRATVARSAQAGGGLAQSGQQSGQMTQILEHTGRNTAAAIAVAAIDIFEQHGGAARLLILPADHLVAHPEAFRDAVETANALLDVPENAAAIVCFGIPPTRPSPAYGYIEAEDQRVQRFVEKPDAALAEAIIARGGLWNAGWFLVRADALNAAFEQHAPEHLAAARSAWEAAKRTSGAFGPVTTIDHGDIADVAFDRAVMEHHQPTLVVAVDCGWTDVGDWASGFAGVPVDAEGHQVVGDALLLHSRQVRVAARGTRLVAAVGLSDVTIVDTPDALLVVGAGQEQQVRSVTRELRARQHSAFLTQPQEERPWGRFAVLETGPRFKIKRVEVRPGGRLSVQRHHHRSEHWVVVQGTAEVLCGEHRRFLHPDESTYIPAGTVHSLHNPGRIDLVLIEVQSGDYVGEDDIERLSDDYGRTDERS